MQQYLYSIVEGLPARWRAPAAGVGAAAVAARVVDGLTVLTSTVETLPTGGPKALALHHDVIATAMDADAVLPFRFGTVVPEAEFDAWLGAHGALIRASLSHVRGSVEMSVKLLRLDLEAALGVAASLSTSTSVTLAAGQIRAVAERLIDRAGLPHWRYRPAASGSNVAATVAFLVPRADVGGFLTRIAPVASHAVGVAVVPTGPWPAYSFVPTFERAITLARMSGVEPLDPRVRKHAG